jgi:hypothetical protein
MSLKLVASALLAMAVTSAPAMACMGPTVLYSDNFQQASPAWQAPPGEMTIAGGHMSLTPPQGQTTAAIYMGGYYDNADTCIDLVSPSVTDVTNAMAGLVFGISLPTAADSSQAPQAPTTMYMFGLFESGQAFVAQFQNGTVVFLVPPQAASAVLAGPNVTNTLRATWNGTSGTAYINGQQFSTFNFPQAFQNALIGLMVAGDASATAGATWNFANLKITNVAPSQ